MSQNIPEYANILSEYIRYPSEEFKEKPAGLFLMEECRKKGLFTEIITHEDSAFNFVASLYPLTSDKPNIVFLNHIDVVPPGDSSLWKYPPYKGVIRDSVIWGRGAIDNKGMAIAELFAIAEFVEAAKEKELPFNVSLLSVSGEETDGIAGAKQVAECFYERLHPYVMFGEGGSGIRSLIKATPETVVFGVSTVEKSKIILHLEMDIPASGHGSVPPKEYAMKEMIFALEKLLKKKPEIRYSRTSVRGLKTLGKYEKGIRGFVQRNFTFLFFKPFVKKQIENDPMLLSFFANTITLTNLIVPEGTANMISRKTTAVFDCRLLPGVSKERFLRNINRRIKDKRVKISIDKEVMASPKTSDPVLFRHLEDALLKVYPRAVVIDMLFPATTDNNFFRNRGLPVYGIFPACFDQDELSSIHNQNERIPFRAIEESIECYINIIDNIMASANNNRLKRKRFWRFRK